MADETLGASGGSSSEIAEDHRAQMIEGVEPADWRDLQEKAAQILRESGLAAETDVQIKLARGRVSVDVLARDADSAPPSVYLCECKHWKRAVTQSVVHSFRAVVADFGANAGFLISSAGFQRGALEAAEFSNVKPVTWAEFQATFVERWYKNFMAPTLNQAGDALIEYTEPLNSRIFRKAEALPAQRQERFKHLRTQYQGASLALMLLWSNPFETPRPPALPLGAGMDAARRHGLQLPDDVLDAVALRPLMEAAIDFYGRATDEFDEVFGERA
jgi:hypothetical protein